MLSVHSLSLHQPPLSLITSKPKTLISPLLVNGHDVFIKKTRTNPSSSLSSWVVHAVDKDSQQQFEVDPDKAKEALQKLDQQLQTLSKKQPSPPRMKASDVKLSSYQMREEMPEISGSFLAFSAGVLLIFTLFYNVLFYTVIKPSIDGPDEPVPATTVELESPKTPVLQLLPLIPEVSIQH